MSYSGLWHALAKRQEQIEESSRAHKCVPIRTSTDGELKGECERKCQSQ